MLYKRLLALISYECHNFTLNFRKEIEEKHECDLRMFIIFNFILQESERLLAALEDEPEQGFQIQFRLPDRTLRRRFRVDAPCSVS